MRDAASPPTAKAGRVGRRPSGGVPHPDPLRGEREADRRNPPAHSCCIKIRRRRNISLATYQGWRLQPAIPDRPSETKPTYPADRPEDRATPRRETAPTEDGSTHAYPPRKLRPFRPSALTLEAICPVSSLATAMPPSSSPAAGESGTPAVRLDRPTRSAPAASSIAAPPRIAPKPIALGRPVANGPAVATTSTIATPGQQAVVPTIPVDLSRYANTITIAAANAPPAHSSSGAAPVSKPGGGSVTPPSQATAPPASAPAAAPTSSVTMLAPIIQPTTLGDTTPASTSSAPIRPMTHAATTGNTSSSAPAVKEMAYGMSSPSGSSSGSSSAAAPPQPSLQISGGGWGGVSSQDFTLPNGVPIGSKVNVTVQAPGDLQIQKVLWSGLAGAKSDYFSTPAESGPNVTPPYLAKQPFVRATVQPPAQTSITFLVDPRATSYSITADVYYVGIAQDVRVTVAFTPVKPNGTLSVISNLPAQSAIQGSATRFQYRGLGTPYPNDAGIRFQATTSIPAWPADPANPNNPPSGYGGSFMIMQTITPSRAYTDNTGANFTVPPDNQVPPANQQDPSKTYPTTKVNLDNYTGSTGGQLQKLTNGETDIYTDAMGQPTKHWIQNFGDAALTLTTADPAAQPLPVNAVSGSINQETADTYLMYMPDGGVWTAIDSIHWSWNVSASAQGNWMPTGQANPSNEAQPADPWPEWAGLTSNIAARPNNGWVAS